MVNDKAEATIHPGNPLGYTVRCEQCGEVATVLFRDVAELLAERHEDEELPPLSVLVDMLDDVVKVLDAVDELVVLHRREAGDDHHALEQLQVASSRIGQAWSATISARKALRPRG